ncbi:hypothetical protein V3C99_014001 [Haemonchus contortus]|uniref:Transposase n=1 Tax=Haemonchus contortus TaxID=6289 RepID=A0A7I4YRM7_HAECO
MLSNAQRKQRLSLRNDQQKLSCDAFVWKPDALNLEGHHVGTKRFTIPTLPYFVWLLIFAQICQLKKIPDELQNPINISVRLMSYDSARGSLLLCISNNPRPR